jgi:signal transduction histidine kinase
MLHQQTVVVEDVYQDDRVPQDVYRPTFVRSLAMVPIRPSAPLGAIGAYWATRRRASQREIELLTAFASPIAVALENAELYRQLEEAVRARDVFLAAASHELRTPLASLRLKAQHALRLHDSGADPTRARRALVDLDRHEHRLSALVNTMLEVAQAEREGVRIETAPVELGALAREVVGRFGDRPDGGPVCVRAPEPVIADCDRSRIAQVVAELVTNALRWGEGRGVEVTVAREPGFACVEVADRGLGIAPEHQERIFERFERNSSVRNFGGLGVGLWLARRFVEAHLGRIDVQSRPGEGSRFTVRLPA